MPWKGVVDSVNVTGSALVLRGWTYFQQGTDKIEVNRVSIKGATDWEAELTRRSDFAEDGLFGFKVILSNRHAIPLVLAEQITIEAHCNSSVHTIPLWKPLRGKLIAALVTQNADWFDDTGINHLVVATLGRARKQSNNISEAAYADLSLPIGMTSYDQSAVVGRDGNVFIYQGNNNLSRLYSQGTAHNIARKWLDLFDIRSSYLTSRGVQALQMFVPEKQSVLTGYYPDAPEGPTVVLRNISDALVNSTDYIDLLPLFENMVRVQGLSPFRKVDSHLSFFGARAVAGLLFRRMIGHDLKVSQPLLKEVRREGDVGSKFGNGSITEHLLIPEVETWSFAKTPRREVRKFDPVGGSHQGIVREWINEDAPINRKILIFGNSMFERGSGPLTLSWWLSYAARNVMFVWSPQVEKRIVEEFEPDVVVMQTVERFMGTVPSH